MEDMVAIDAGNAKVVCMIYINRNATMRRDRDAARIITTHDFSISFIYVYRVTWHASR